jgi:hypothetical protein
MYVANFIAGTASQHTVAKIAKTIPAPSNMVAAATIKKNVIEIRHKNAAIP